MCKQITVYFINKINFSKRGYLRFANIVHKKIVSNIKLKKIEKLFIIC